MPAARRRSGTSIPRAAFNRLVREIVSQMVADVNGWGDPPLDGQAADAVQQAAEWFLIELFDDALLCARHARRVTVNRADIQLVCRLRGWERPSP